MDSTAFLFGIDALLASDPSWKTHRIGLLTNDAARTQNGEKSRVALLKQNYQLVRLFSPEHGMKILRS
ncbi:MAG: exo-beta-N-acetylmuramidase NamZ domain-containing protein [Crocinitomicaceae bacterium]